MSQFGEDRKKMRQLFWCNRLIDTFCMMRKHFFDNWNSASRAMSLDSVEYQSQKVAFSTNNSDRAGGECIHSTL